MILYEGKSRIDGAPIVCVATGIKAKSANEKTGDMVQLWILRSDIEPPAAQKTGEDYSVCGNCPLRPSRGGGCYVNTGQVAFHIRVYRPLERWTGDHAGALADTGRSCGPEVWHFPWKDRNPLPDRST